MDFRIPSQIYVLVFSLIANTLTVGCTMGNLKDKDNKSEKIIGQPVNQLSKVVNVDESNKSFVSVYDKTVHRIHVFELNEPKHESSFAVTNPEQKHFVINDPKARYIFDLSQRDFTIHRQNEDKPESLVQLLADPVSTAYNAEKNIFVIYDENQNTNIIQVSEDGKVLKVFTAGGALYNKVSINCGDILPDGNLILAMSNGDIVIIDTQKTLDNQTWEIKTKFTTPILNPIWLAPMNNNQVIIYTRSYHDNTFLSEDHKMYLVDLSTQVTSNETILSQTNLVKLSKEEYPHLVFSKYSEMGNQVETQHDLVYFKDQAFQQKSIRRLNNIIYGSYLDVTANTWTISESTESTNQILRRWSIFNDNNLDKVQRRILKYSTQNLTLLNAISIEPNVEVKLSSHSALNLFESPLGFAKIINLDNNSTSILKMFNLKYLK